MSEACYGIAMTPVLPIADRPSFRDGRDCCTRREVLSGAIAIPIAACPVSACAAPVSSIKLNVLDFIPANEHARIVTGTSEFDCTTAINNAIRQAEKVNGTLHMGKGVYLVSSLRITGSRYKIDTEEGAMFRQRGDLSSDQPHPVIEVSHCSGVIIGQLTILGNIATDQGEHHHAVIVGMSRDVTIGSIFARNVRGDVLYCYGRDTSHEERLDGLRVKSVSGHNVFRNLVSITGGRVTIGEVINAGPVGYRDLDIEPNSQGRYQPGEVVIGKAVVGSLEVTSDDPKTRSLSVTIGEIDADGRRIQPTTPPYPTAPGRNGYALGIAHVVRMDITRATLRNYASYAVSLGPNHGDIRFRNLDIANCDFDEHTFNSAIAKRGRPAGDRLVIDRVRCVHPDNSKWLIHSDQPGMPVVIGGGEVLGGLLAVNCVLDAQALTIDAGGAEGRAANILMGGSGSRLRSVSIREARRATLLFNSPDCSLVSVHGDVAAITDDASTNVRVSTSTIRPAHLTNG